VVIALGGGVVGDMAGFAAATFMRGVALIQAPTSLLAMVDASIGGKVAVDHPAGKNLIGAFKFPSCVIEDLAVLETLPIEEYHAGMAEVIKHGIIGDAGLFNELAKREAGRQEADSGLLERALRVKIEIVEQDPYEENIRAHLNLGHTFGQAIERLANYRMRHGDAVAMGMSVAAHLAVNLRLCNTAARDRILSLLAKHELPVSIPREFSAVQVLDAMGTDKKIQDGKLRLILPREIGRVEIVNNIPEDEILRALNDSY
jgi:3-dehydroquinate synthase